MSQAEIDRYLSRLDRSLPLAPAERDKVTAELRDHLEERLAELAEQGVPHELAVRQALGEFGDPAELAAEFQTISHERRRRLIMRCTTGSLAALVAALLVALALWPDTPQLPFFGRAVAQSKDKPDAKARTSSKEENNAKTESLLASVRVKAQFDQVPLSDLLEYVQDMAGGKEEKAKVQIHFDRRALEEAGVRPADQMVSVKLADVRLDMLLDLVLREVGSGYYVDDGIVFVTSKEQLESRMEVRVYNCRDLLKLARLPGDMGELRRGAGPGGPGPGGLGPDGGPRAPGPGADGGVPGGIGPGGIGGGGGFGGGLGGIAGEMPGPSGPGGELIDILQHTVRPESWDVQGGPGSISDYRGLIVVSNTIEIHRKIDRVLEMLREAAEREPSAEAKDRVK